MYSSASGIPGSLYKIEMNISKIYTYSAEVSISYTNFAVGVGNSADLSKKYAALDFFFHFTFTFKSIAAI